MEHQVLQQFWDSEPALKQHKDISLATCTKILVLLQNPQELLALKLEQAAVINIGSYFVKATYNLEGDGALSGVTQPHHSKHAHMEGIGEGLHQ